MSLVYIVKKSENCKFWCLSSKFITQFISNLTITFVYFVGTCLKGVWSITNLQDCSQDLLEKGITTWWKIQKVFIFINSSIRACFINWTKLAKDPIPRNTLFRKVCFIGMKGMSTLISTTETDIFEILTLLEWIKPKHSKIFLLVCLRKHI